MEPAIQLLLVPQSRPCHLFLILSPLEPNDYKLILNYKMDPKGCKKKENLKLLVFTPFI
jgi:hypothetical protein